MTKWIRNTRCDKKSNHTSTNGEDKMNDWSKVEKTKKVATEQDIFWEYVKIFLYLLAGMAYAYFVILGKTL